MESVNVHFFCDGCVEEVNRKLHQHVDGNAKQESNNFVTKHEMDEQTKCISASIEKTFNILKNEISSLKESNIDLVRLMSSKEFQKNRKIQPSQKKPDDGLVTYSDKTLQNQKARPDRILENDGGLNEPIGKKTYAKAVQEKSVIKINDSAITDQPGQQRRFKGPTNPRNKERSDSVKGSGRPSKLLQPAPRGRNWIWLGGLQSDTTAENIKEYAEERWPNKDVLCFDLRSKNPKKSFKFGSSDISFEELLQPEAWPEGVRIRLFRNIE